MKNTFLKLIIAAGLAFAVCAPVQAQQHRQYQQTPRLMPQQHQFVRPQFQQHNFVQQHNFGGYRGDGGYVVQQPSQPYCYDTATGNFLHWGNCYGDASDYAPPIENE